MMLRRSIKYRFMVTVALILLLTTASFAQYTFPGKTWQKADKPEDLGYSSELLQKAQDYSGGLKTAAVVIVVNGKILKEWGEVETEFMTHSTRKSFLSALYGNYVKNGKIDITKTLAELGIDDEPPLSNSEKQATVRDCLKARSGIYHDALYESAGMRALKPPRYSEKPGTHWYYNNWDFNVLCTIFEKLTGKKFYEALQADIGDKIGMEHFSAEDGQYFRGPGSIHAAYPFVISARDMARFGLLMLRNGKWKNEQVIPAGWVKESTDDYSDAALYHIDGYGFMWWVAKDNNKYPHLPNVTLKEGTFSARGAGGHYIIVIPEYDMVVVHRVNTFVRGNFVTGNQMGSLLNLILKAKL